MLNTDEAKNSFEEFKKIYYPFKRYGRIKYDPVEDLNRREIELSFSLLAKPVMGKNEKSTQAWYESRMAEIKAAEKAYRQKLEDAEESGAFSSDEFFKALNNLDFPHSPFEKARQEAGIYLKF